MGIRDFLSELFGRSPPEDDSDIERILSTGSSEKIREYIVNRAMEDIVKGLPSYERMHLEKVLEKRQKKVDREEDKGETDNAKPSQDGMQTVDRNPLTKLELQDYLRTTQSGEHLEETEARINSDWREEMEREIQHVLEDDDFLYEIGEIIQNRPPLKEIDETMKRYELNVRKGGPLTSKDFLRLAVISKTHYGGDGRKLLADLNTLPENKRRMDKMIQIIGEHHYRDDPEARYIMNRLFGMPCEKDDRPSNDYIDMALGKLRLYYSAFLGSDKGIEVDAMAGFFRGYFELKFLFPDFENVHRGYLSSVVIDDIANPAEEVATFRRGNRELTREHKIAGSGHNFSHHVMALQRIMMRDAVKLLHIQQFEHPYKPAERGLEDLEYVFKQAFDERDETCLSIGYNRQQLQEVIKNAGISKADRQQLQEVLRGGASESDKKEVAEKMRSCVQNALKELSVKRTRGGGDIPHLQLHDYLLPIYLRLESEETIKLVRTGMTLSTFLKLDPKTKIRRCTAGDGGLRLVSYQYGLDPSVEVIDMCLDSPANCVAEAILVHALDEQGGPVGVIEIAEASPDAYLLPDYEGNPTWAYLLLEEILERSYRREEKTLMFSTGVDEKPAINHFYAVAEKLFGFQGTPQDLKKYSPCYRKKEGQTDFWDEFLTTKRWRGKPDNGEPVKLEKRDRLEELRPAYLDEIMKAYQQSPHLQSQITRENVRAMAEEFLKNPMYFFSETYLGAWGIDDNIIETPDSTAFDKDLEASGLKGDVEDPEIQEEKVKDLRDKRNALRRPISPFNYISHQNINNGRGYVRGFVYTVTKDKYDAFKKKMGEFRTSIGLKCE